MVNCRKFVYLFRAFMDFSNDFQTGADSSLVELLDRVSKPWLTCCHLYQSTLHTWLPDNLGRNGFKCFT